MGVEEARQLKNKKKGYGQYMPFDVIVNFPLSKPPRAQFGRWALFGSMLSTDRFDVGLVVRCIKVYIENAENESGLRLRIARREGDSRRPSHLLSTPIDM